MRVCSIVAVLAVALFGCRGGPSKDEAPAKTEPANVRPGPESIKRAKEGVQKANEAGVRRTDDALDRATQGESVPRGAPERR